MTDEELQKHKEVLLSAFRLGICMADAVNGAAEMGSTQMLRKCLGQLQGLANGDFSTIGSPEDIVPPEARGADWGRDDLASIGAESRQKERRLASVILSCFARPAGE